MRLKLINKLIEENRIKLMTDETGHPIYKFLSEVQASKLANIETNEQDFFYKIIEEAG